MANKKNWLAMLVIAFVFGTVAVGVVDAQTTIQGTWESGTTVIYFSTGGIFIIYENGNFGIDGSYSISAVRANQPQTITLTWGIFDLMEQELNFNISTNQLIFSGELRDRYNYLINPGTTFRRSSFVESEAGNPLIGVWKSGSEIYRFYRGDGGRLFGNHRRNGHGTLFSYQNEPEFTERWRFRISYEFNNTDRTAGNITLWGFNENWSYGAIVDYPFVINNNVLRVQYEGGTGEFTRQ